MLFKHYHFNYYYLLQTYATGSLGLFCLCHIPGILYVKFFIENDSTLCRKKDFWTEGLNVHVLYYQSNFLDKL